MTDLQRITVAVRHLAHDFPNAWYPALPEATGTQRYTRGRPSHGPNRDGCLLGQAVCLALPDLHTVLEELDARSELTSVEGLIQALGLDDTSEMDQLRVLWLRQVQTRQDQEQVWSRCVAEADAGSGIAERYLVCGGIRVVCGPDSPAGMIVSSLRDDATRVYEAGDQLALDCCNAAIDGLESLVLAAACAGIDITAANFVQAVETAKDAIGNQYGE